jgi:hypothetical protein
LHYDKTSRGALAYLALAGEFLRRQQTAAGLADKLETVLEESAESST